MGHIITQAVSAIRQVLSAINGLTVTYIVLAALICGFICTLIFYIYRRSSGGKVMLHDAQPQTPRYSPFETPIGCDDPNLNQLYAPNQPPPEEFERGAIMCPNCNVSVPIDDAMCWNCGEMLKRQSIMRLCPTCHQEMPEHATNCSRCGSNLDGSTIV